MIKNVAIVGGTHGNEYTGIYLLKQWQKNKDIVERDSFELEMVFANPRAYDANRRYTDCDLNRQFLLHDLANSELSNYEQSRAKVINQQLGPKGTEQTKCDFIIDLHNTTSNMGPSLIILQSDDFNLKLAAYVKMKMPKAVIVLEDQIPVAEQAYLCSVAPQGVIIEIGPQPQSVLRQDILDWMQEMTTHVLDYVDLSNQGELPQLPEAIELFKYTETLKLPEDEDGERLGVVHKNVQDADFTLLSPGDPIFTLFDGTEISWDGDYEAYPHFINEAAYYDNNLAFSLATKEVRAIPS